MPVSRYSAWNRLKYMETTSTVSAIVPIFPSGASGATSAIGGSLLYNLLQSPDGAWCKQRLCHDIGIKVYLVPLSGYSSF